MSGISFKLEAFEGPLDLLLELISKHKLNIYDIEISILLDQYLEYIGSLDEQDFDGAGEFLTMAARLVYIKTCSLLPQAEEAQELKKELEGELIEYSACKEAAKRLAKINIYGEVFVRPPEKLPINKVFTGNMPVQRLIEAYMGMSPKSRRIKPLKAEQFSPIVASRIVTVTSKIVFVLKKLYKTGECAVSELYDGVEDKSARVATFLAVLELAKSGRVFLNDDNTLITFNRNSPRKHKRDETKDNIMLYDETEDVITVSNEIEMQQGTEITQETVLPTEEAKNESPTKEKYALEAIRTHRMTAVAVFAPITVEDAKPEAQEIFDEPEECVEEYTDEPIESVQEKQDDKHQCIKTNRFCRRWRWRYPRKHGSCWVYGRERFRWN